MDIEINGIKIHIAKEIIAYWRYYNLFVGHFKKLYEGEENEKEIQ